MRGEGGVGGSKIREGETEEREGEGERVNRGNERGDKRYVYLLGLQ